jgi:hypothetical protein
MRSQNCKNVWNLKMFLMFLYSSVIHGADVPSLHIITIQKHFIFTCFHAKWNESRCYSSPMERSNNFVKEWDINHTHEVYCTIHNFLNIFINTSTSWLLCNAEACKIWQSHCQRWAVFNSSFTFLSYRMFFSSCLTNTGPPDSPLVLRRTPSLGRFNSQ